MNGGTKPPRERRLTIDFTSGKITEGAEYSDEEQAKLDRRREMYSIAAKLEQGAELTADERQAVARVLRRDLAIEFYRQEALDTVYAEAVKDSDRQSSATFLYLDLMRESGGEAAREAFEVGRAIEEVKFYGGKRSLGRIIRSFTAYYRARGLTPYAAEKRISELLGKELENVKRKRPKK